MEADVAHADAPGDGFPIDRQCAGRRGHFARLVEQIEHAIQARQIVLQAVALSASTPNGSSSIAR